MKSHHSLVYSVSGFPLAKRRFSLIKHIHNGLHHFLVDLAVQCMVNTLAERCLFLPGKLPVALFLQPLQFFIHLLLIGNRPLRVQNGIMPRMGAGADVIGHIMPADLVFVRNHGLMMEADDKILRAMGNKHRHIGAVDALYRIKLGIVLEKQRLIGLQKFLRETACQRVCERAGIFLSFFCQQRCRP
mgnify:CR=1 FL=1